MKWYEIVVTCILCSAISSAMVMKIQANRYLDILDDFAHGTLDEIKKLCEIIMSKIE